MTRANKLSRRQFIDLSRRFGAKAAIYGAGTLALSGSLPMLSSFLARDVHAQAKAKYKLRWGASTINEKNDQHVVTGIFEFVKQLETLTDGEVHVQMIGSGGACVENACGDKVANGVLDMGSSSSQNLGSVFPYSVAIDFPFLWNDRGDLHKMLYAKEMNPVYRDVWRKRYGIELIYQSNEMRNIMMGAKYDSAPEVRTPEALRGAKMRITNSEMIRAFAAGIGMNPIPLAWTELLEGLKSGVVDAAETWPGAATGFGMHKVLAQDVAVEFCPGSFTIFVASRSFDKLPDRIKEAFYEAGSLAMKAAYDQLTVAQNEVIGNGDKPSAESAYKQSKIRLIRLTAAERAAFKELAGVEGKNRAAYDAVRKQLDELAGLDVYGALKEFADKTKGQPVAPEKWWA
jgi:TRAP-type C4-dicarboxylate transport system substrate-binding protein